MDKGIKREFIHATYCKSKISDVEDLLVVKEKLHHPDGTIKDNLRFIKNYERNFYITKKEFRNHQQKKEFEYIDYCDEYKCTQAELIKKAAKLTDNWKARTISQVNESPYIYGTDITTPVLLHQAYNEQWPELVSDSTLAIMDYETDVLYGTNEIIAGTLTYKDKVALVATKGFLDGMDKIAELRVKELFSIYLGKYEKERNIKLEFIICNDSAECVIELFKRAHMWKPDFLGFWNISFDIGKVIGALDKAKIDKALVFSDPSVPKEFKFFNYNQDTPYKVKADGTRMTKHFADLWHKVYSPASFQCIDLMCLFKRLRVREGQRNSYSLDSILGDELNISKLKFKEADGLTGLEWHIEMQRNYKLEYLIYCAFDGISVELLDEFTNDVSRGLRAAADISEITRLNSNPKRLSDAMYFILKNEKKIIGSISPDMTEDLDKYTPSKVGWILTLSSDLQHNTGRKIIKEYPALESRVILNAFDIDIESGYPTAGAIANVSKGTTRYEVCKIMGLSEDEGRAVGVNLSAPITNALDIANKIFNYPTLSRLEEEFNKVGLK